MVSRKQSKIKLVYGYLGYAKRGVPDLFIYSNNQVVSKKMKILYKVRC
jgi:hypothetical protein